MLLIKIKVKPGSKENSLLKISADTFKISVKAKPKNNMANKAVIEMLAKHLNISREKVIIIKGHKSPNKTVKIYEENK